MSARFEPSLHHTGAPHARTPSPLAAVSPVRVTLADLVRLAPLARELELWREREFETGGSHHSVFKGRGMEFAETRPYQPGDDIRHIDWRVTARTGRAHTKLFREERERPTILWIDLRASMFFATRGVFKAVLAAQLAALIAWIAHTRGDRVGGRVLSEAADTWLDVKRGRPAVLRLLRSIERGFAAHAVSSNTQTSASTSLRQLARTIKPGSCVVLLSDFAQIDAEALSAVKQLGPHNDLTLCHIHDPLESALPPPGLYPISAPDGQSSMLDSAPAEHRHAYQRHFAERAEQLRSEASNHRARYLCVATTANPVEVLRDRAIRPRAAAFR